MGYFYEKIKNFERMKFIVDIPGVSGLPEGWN
jgi:hypothetical protein